MSKMTTKQRWRKLEDCGKSAFGDCCGRKAKKAGHPRYPLTKPGSCDHNCKAMHNAFKRAAQQHERKIKAKIVRLAKQAGCRWAEDK